MPAQTVEGFVPQIKKKGRLQIAMHTEILVFVLNNDKSMPHIYRLINLLKRCIVEWFYTVENGELPLNAFPREPLGNAKG